MFPDQLTCYEKGLTFKPSLSIFRTLINILTSTTMCLKPKKVESFKIQISNNFFQLMIRDKNMFYLQGRTITTLF